MDVNTCKYETNDIEIFTHKWIFYDVFSIAKVIAGCS